MTQLYLQDFGTVCKLYIYSDTQEELEYQFNSFYNWQATSGYLSDIDNINDRFSSFIWTNRRKLIKYFCNIIEHHYFMVTGREPEGELFRRRVRELAERRYLTIERRQGISGKKGINVDTYHLSCDLTII